MLLCWAKYFRQQSTSGTTPRIRGRLEQRLVYALCEHSGLARKLVMVQDALIGEHVEVQKLLLSRKGKVFRKGIGLVEHTVPEAESG